MRSFGGIVEHLAAIPALISTAPSWNSELATAVLAMIAAATYVRMGCEIVAEARGE
ncbi:hypothetical protein [Kribbella catacumbae]|uniref:hypothetical protein n=1 Tax=Kribbella catacumbae TaxID=460086 RepID=UPI0012FC333F|nr:hypothetical protein [Kribbella catacumbae]